MESLTDATFEQAIQHTRISDEEVKMYSDFFMIAEQFEMKWLRQVALNDILLIKSRDGWLVKVKATILQRISQSMGNVGETIGEVSRDIKEAFSG